MLRVTHSSGFFSCCAVRLDTVIGYWNQTKKLPIGIDSKGQFLLYKPEGVYRDISVDYFQKPPAPAAAQIAHRSVIPYNFRYQFNPYSSFVDDRLRQFVGLYFKPTPMITRLQETIRSKYSIDYENTCVLFYRGNDKQREILLPDYSPFFSKAKELLKERPGLRFLLQSDETEFLEEGAAALPNTVCLTDYIRHIPRSNTSVDLLDTSNNYDFSKKFLAITLLMSNCAYVLCNSGNCSMWIALYRSSFDGFYQFTKGEWVPPPQKLGAPAADAAAHTSPTPDRG